MNHTILLFGGLTVIALGWAVVVLFEWRIVGICLLVSACLSPIVLWGWL